MSRRSAWAARLERRLGTLVRVETSDPVVALTFDDGPDPEATPQLLALLRARDAKATFFVDGTAASFYPHIVADAQQDGHCVASHGFSHRSAVFDPEAGRFRTQVRELRQVSRSTRLLHYYRPPYGHESRQTRWAALVTGHTLVGWSAAALDWRVEPASVLAARLIQIVVPGTIVLLHDGLRTAEEEAAFDRTTTLEALEVFLEHRRHEFSFVTVPELIEHGRPVYRMRRPQPSPLPDLRERSSL